MSSKNYRNVVFMVMLLFVLTAVVIYGVFFDVPLYMDMP